MEGGNGHPFSHVEAVSATSLYPGVEVENGAASLVRSFEQVGQQLTANAQAAVRLCGDEVIDVELAQCGRAGHQTPTSHTDATTIGVSSRESQPLRVALCIDRSERVSRQLVTELVENGQDFGSKTGVPRQSVDDLHATIITHLSLR
jgi:hypothetical protein